jgi:hypothetical protein
MPAIQDLKDPKVGPTSSELSLYERQKDDILNMAGDDAVQAAGVGVLAALLRDLQIQQKFRVVLDDDSSHLTSFQIQILSQYYLTGHPDASANPSDAAAPPTHVAGQPSTLKQVCAC